MEKRGLGRLAMVTISRRAAAPRGGAARAQAKCKHQSTGSEKENGDACQEEDEASVFRFRVH